MTLSLSISCSSKPRLVLPFWCQLTWVVPDKIQEGRKTVVCDLSSFGLLYSPGNTVKPTWWSNLCTWSIQDKRHHIILLHMKDIESLSHNVSWWIGGAKWFYYNRSQRQNQMLTDFYCSIFFIYLLVGLGPTFLDNWAKPSLNWSLWNLYTMCGLKAGGAVA